MHVLTQDELVVDLKQRRVSARLVRELRYSPQNITHWDDRDFVAVTTKSGNEGVLVYGDYRVPFTLARKAANSSGRAEAIICDICATWQRGSNAARITFTTSATATRSYLVCADLDCSLHVRDMTPASKISRTQLREHMGSEARVARLHARLSVVLHHVQ